MNRRTQLQALMAVLFAGFMLSSCGNIDIVKRRYRPGFHVDISKKRQKTKVYDQSVAVDNRKVEKTTAIDSRKGQLTSNKVNDNLSASLESQSSSKFTTNAQKKSNLKSKFATREFKSMTFERRVKEIKREVFRPTSAAAGMDWMKWVSFGTGIGSMVFGFLALLFAILTVSFISSFVWGAIVLALILAAAAITFSIIYKKNNGTGSQARLGMIFGIIGAGLAVLAIILWAIFFTIFWL